MTRLPLDESAVPTTLATTADELHGALEAASMSGSRIVLVPTMGALHDGHLLLLEHAATLGDLVVATIFVNPTQFGPGEDFDRYPRDLDHDLAMCSRAGVGVVFAPAVDEVYPPIARHLDITVDPGPLGRELEGATRPGHFSGVLTVVASLMSLTGPSTVVLGEKDYQQLVLVRAFAAQYARRARVVGVPTVRDPDGLAMSSRNRYLSDDERSTALAIPAALRAGTAAAIGGAPAAVAAARGVLDQTPGLEVDYVELREAHGLGPVRPGDEARLLVAARVGSTRLIDNAPVVVPA